MAINVIDNFSYRGKKPNFDRDSFDTLSAMKSFPETDIDEGHISFCKEDGMHYKFSSANEVDPTTGKWREDKKLPDNIVLSKPSTEMPSIADVILGNILTKVEQELTPEEQVQVQTNIGVKSTVDVVGAGEVTVNELFDAAESDKLINVNGSISQAAGYYYSKPFSAKRGDIIIGKMYASSATSLISEMTADGNFISSFEAGNGGAKNVFFVVKKDMYLSISSYKPFTNIYRISCKLANALAEPAGGYNRKEYESIGAVWSDVKGKWVHDRLEMTEAEMFEFWRYGIVKNINYCDSFLRSKRGVRKVLFDIAYPIPNIANNMNCFARDSDIEQVSIRGNYDYIKVKGAAYYMFYSCKKLKEINVILDFEEATNIDNAFALDASLVTVKIKSLKSSTTFKDSPLISVEDTADSSLGYLVGNAKNTEPITVVLHPDAFARVAQTLIDKATAKQISIASA